MWGCPPPPFQTKKYQFHFFRKFSNFYVGTTNGLAPPPAEEPRSAPSLYCFSTWGFKNTFWGFKNSFQTNPSENILFERQRTASFAEINLFAQLSRFIYLFSKNYDNQAQYHFSIIYTLFLVYNNKY